MAGKSQMERDVAVAFSFAMSVTKPVVALVALDDCGRIMLAAVPARVSWRHARYSLQVGLTLADHFLER